MICSYKDCNLKGIDQPEDQFISTNGKYRTRSCLTCRIRSQGYNKRSRNGQTDVRNGGQASQVVLRQSRAMQPGEPPKFAFDWEEKMHREWLLKMIEVVKADSLTPGENDDIVSVSSHRR